MEQHNNGVYSILCALFPSKVTLCFVLLSPEKLSIRRHSVAFGNLNNICISFTVTTGSQKMDLRGLGLMHSVFTGWVYAWQTGSGKQLPSSRPGVSLLRTEFGTRCSATKLGNLPTLSEVPGDPPLQIRKIMT
jgi:hypothetical protein